MAVPIKILFYLKAKKDNGEKHYRVSYIVEFIIINENNFELSNYVAIILSGFSQIHWIIFFIILICTLAYILVDIFSNLAKFGAKIGINFIEVLVN